MIRTSLVEADEDRFTPSDDQWVDILRDEQGFHEYSDAELEEWVPIARASGFKRVRGTRLTECPECAENRLQRIGQYVHYSNLVHLERCARCDLVFSDLLLPPEIVREHFEVAYKSERYFEERRSKIFAVIADLAESCLPRGGRVIDIGGAQGHLLAALKTRRPDIDLLLNDLSDRACEHAAEAYGLPTVCGPVVDLATPETPFDLALLVDVIYYEPNLAGLWSSIDRIVGTPGSLILRVPNSFQLLRGFATLARIVSPRRARYATSLRLFNPEHIYVFTRRYLEQRLTSLGFANVEFLPSPMLAGGGARRWISHLVAGAGWLTAKLTIGRVVASPSMLVLARRPSRSHD